MINHVKIIKEYIVRPKKHAGTFPLSVKALPTRRVNSQDKRVQAIFEGLWGSSNSIKPPGISQNHHLSSQNRRFLAPKPQRLHEPQIQCSSSPCSPCYPLSSRQISNLSELSQILTRCACRRIVCDYAIDISNRFIIQS